MLSDPAGEPRPPIVPTLMFTGDVIGRALVDRITQAFLPMQKLDIAAIEAAARAPR